MVISFPNDVSIKSLFQPLFFQMYMLNMSRSSLNFWDNLQFVQLLLSHYFCPIFYCIIYIYLRVIFKLYGSASTYRKMCWKEPCSWTTKDIIHRLFFYRFDGFFNGTLFFPKLEHGSLL